MMMIMIRMTMTMTMIVVMSCGNSTSYVLTESPSTSQNSFCYCLYFLFSYKRSAALGQFVIHRGLIISVMQVGWHALHLNFPYFMRRASWLTSPLANKLSSGIFFCCKVPPFPHEDTGKVKHYDNWKERKIEGEGGSRPLTVAVFQNKVEFIWVWLEWIWASTNSLNSGWKFGELQVIFVLRAWPTDRKRTAKDFGNKSKGKNKWGAVRGCSKDIGFDDSHIVSSQRLAPVESLLSCWSVFSFCIRRCFLVYSILLPVSYTHLTLPTIYSV